MADEAALMTVCPWCSEPLPTLGVPDCPSCGAHLVEDTSVEVPGVTAIDPGLLRVAAAPRKVKRTFGSLLVGDDDEIPPPSEAEMPALARPDAEVKREMLRLEMEARLAALQAEARMLDAEDGIVGGADAPPPDPGAVEPPDIADPPDTVDRSDTPGS
jgi:hypothetical protein